MNKLVPKDIKFDYRIRGFYCPSCETGVALQSKKCSNCGQALRNPYASIIEEDKENKTK